MMFASTACACRPSTMSGWVGKFVSYSPSGAGEDDVRFQDVWLRAFQEKGDDGRFHMKMIRKADQEAKSWPRGGDRHSTGVRLPNFHM